MTGVIQIMDNFTVYNIHAYVTAGLSLGLNFLLIYFIIKRTSKEMAAFQVVMLQTCFVDILFAIASSLMLIQAETSGYQIFFRVATVPIFWYGYGPCIGLWLWQVALMVLFWSMLIQAMYRYYTIVKRQTPSTLRLWLIQGIIVVLAMLMTLPALTTPCDNPLGNGPLKTMGLWENFPELHFTFRSAYYRTPAFIAYTAALVLPSILSNCVFFYLTYKVKSCLSSSKSHFSQQTIRIHSQFQKKLLLQSIMPVFSLSVMTAIVLYIFVLPPDDADLQGGMLLVALMPLQYIIVMNPIITILSIRSYRNAVICRSRSDSNLVTVAATTSYRTSSMARLT